jgi:hydrogenase maturation protease
MNSVHPVGLEGRLKSIVKGRKLVILCVGNPVRGDDGAPQRLYRKLRGNVVRLRLLDCGTTPQDWIEEVVRLRPHIVIFVDAVDRSLKPGSIILDGLHLGSSTGSSLLGHKVPLAWVASLLKIIGRQRRFVIKTFLIGIQIGSTKGAITVPVRKSVSKLSRLFHELDSIVVGDIPGQARPRRYRGHEFSRA